MWLILLCLSGQTGDCDDDALAHARVTQWRAEAAIAGELNAWGGRRNHWMRLPDWDDVDGEARYLTQRECLTALRRALPERDEIDREHVTEVSHGRDYVRHVEYLVPPPTPFGISEYACFFEAPLVG